jgi:hypothetical protein
MIAAKACPTCRNSAHVPNALYDVAWCAACGCQAYAGADSAGTLVVLAAAPCGRHMPEYSRHRNDVYRAEVSA